MRISHTNKDYFFQQIEYFCFKNGVRSPFNLLSVKLLHLFVDMDGLLQRGQEATAKILKATRKKLKRQLDIFQEFGFITIEGRGYYSNSSFQLYNYILDDEILHCLTPGTNKKRKIEKLVEAKITDYLGGSNDSK